MHNKSGCVRAYVIREGVRGCLERESVDCVG